MADNRRTRGDEIAEFLKSPENIARTLGPLLKEFFQQGGEVWQLRRIEKSILARAGAAVALNKFFSPFDETRAPKPLIPGNAREDAITVFFSSDAPFVCDMRERRGWELESDVECETGEITLELAGFLNPCDEKSVNGILAAKRAKEIGANLGQRHAEAILRGQCVIPLAWKEFPIHFPGTIWRDADGKLRAVCLDWFCGRWELFFDHLDLLWRGRDRLLRPRKAVG